jgi:hypothetical protein
MEPYHAYHEHIVELLPDLHTPSLLVDHYRMTESSSCGHDWIRSHTLHEFRYREQASLRRILSNDRGENRYRLASGVQPPTIQPNSTRQPPHTCLARLQDLDIMNVCSYSCEYKDLLKLQMPPDLVLAWRNDQDGIQRFLHARYDH